MVLTRAARRAAINERNALVQQYNDTEGMANELINDGERGLPVQHLLDHMRMTLDRIEELSLALGIPTGGDGGDGDT